VGFPLVAGSSPREECSSNDLQDFDAIVKRLVYDPHAEKLLQPSRAQSEVLGKQRRRKRFVGESHRQDCANLFGEQALHYALWKCRGVGVNFRV